MHRKALVTSEWRGRLLACSLARLLGPCLGHTGISRKEDSWQAKDKTTLEEEPGVEGFQEREKECCAAGGLSPVDTCLLGVCLSSEHRNYHPLPLSDFPIKTTDPNGLPQCMALACMSVLLQLSQQSCACVLVCRPSISEALELSDCSAGSCFAAYYVGLCFHSHIHVYWTGVSALAWGKGKLGPKHACVRPHVGPAYIDAW